MNENEPDEIGGAEPKAHYQREDQVDVREMSRVFASSGIQRPCQDIERLQRMIENSNLIVTARMDGRLVGIARCLSDFSWGCYVSDLAVEKEQQHRGIGKELLRVVRELAGDDCTVILNAGPGAEGYYPKVGFEPVPTAWKVHRKR